MKINFDNAGQIINLAQLIVAALPGIESGLKDLFDNAPGQDMTHDELVAVIDAYNAKQDEEDKKFEDTTQD